MQQKDALIKIMQPSYILEISFTIAADLLSVDYTGTDAQKSVLFMTVT